MPHLLAVVHDRPLHGAGVAVEDVHAEGARGEKVTEVGLVLEGAEMEHVLPAEADVPHGGRLDVDVPFERVLGEGQGVAVGRPEDLGDARLDPRRPRLVEPDNLGHQVLEDSTDSILHFFTSHKAIQFILIFHVIYRINKLYKEKGSAGKKKERESV